MVGRCNPALVQESTWKHRVITQNSHRRCRAPVVANEGLAFTAYHRMLPRMAAIPVTAELPLFVDLYGTLRVQGTRVTLDSVVTAFRAGATAEDIAQKFPSVSLADAHLIIAHYLHHAAEIDSYLSGATG